ncbi:uncharacterized protein A4U43_C07F9790 [Asparagus officinalis]|uniref:Uncharacterized protein n=1 Tax=Asparagus officinalis TaxID=4686 RepID=A0A5P1EDR8_ASPOF|nr:uncharacterized protein A4U43_C07F9790 [Asparagus officinalis]
MTRPPISPPLSLLLPLMPVNPPMAQVSSPYLPALDAVLFSSRRSYLPCDPAATLRATNSSIYPAAAGDVTDEASQATPSAPPRRSVPIRPSVYCLEYIPSRSRRPAVRQSFTLGVVRGHTNPPTRTRASGGALVRVFLLVRPVPRVIAVPLS